MDTRMNVAFAPVDQLTRPTGPAVASAAPKPAPVENAKPAQKITREVVEEATKKIQKFVEPKAAELQFSIDDDSGLSVVKIIDMRTKELIRQIPSQDIIDMSNTLERLQGLLLKNKA